MLLSVPSQTLYRIDECPDLMADGCISDEHGNLVFLSLWARDTAVQELLARLTLGRDPQGLDQFHLITGQGHSVPVFVNNVDDLDKRLTRAYRRTLFGSLTHLWLFDRRVLAPDKANARAMAIVSRSTVSADCQARLWRLVRDTCPLPLLDHWRDPVLDLLRNRAMLRPLPLALGPLVGFYLELDVPELTRALGELIRNGTLAASDIHSGPRVPLLQAA